MLGQMGMFFAEGMQEGGFIEADAVSEACKTVVRPEFVKKGGLAGGNSGLSGGNIKTKIRLMRPGFGDESYGRAGYITEELAGSEGEDAEIVDLIEQTDGQTFEDGTIAAQDLVVG